MFQAEKLLPKHSNDAAFIKSYQSPKNKYPKHIQLHLNENFQGPYPEIEKVMLAYNASLCWRYPENGDDYLQQSIADCYGVNQARVFVNNGASAILEQIFRSLLKPGDDVLLPSPTWSFYHDTLVKQSVNINNVAMSIVGNDFIIDEDNFSLKAKHINPKLIILCSPNNPTGSRIDGDLIIKICNKNKRSIVILDEAYFGYTQISQDFISMKLENLIIVRSFSKIFGLAGFRVGFGISSEKLASQIKLNSPVFGVSQLSQEVAVNALKYPIYYQQLAINLRRVLKIFTDKLNMKKWTIFETHSNFVLLQHYELSGKEITQQVYDSGFVIKPLTIGNDQRYIRITIGSLKDMQKLASILNQIS
jgi:histidinol-phosphate aminotransferase